MTQVEQSATVAERTRVFIVDDHPIVRQGLAQMINQEADLIVCGEAEDAQSALQAVAELHPALVLVDLSLKGAVALTSSGPCGRARVCYRSWWCPCTTSPSMLSVLYELGHVDIS